MQYDRTTRQKICIKKWLQNKLKGTIVACTGFGFLKNGSRSLLEYNELLSGKIKRSPEKDNPEITSEDLLVSEVLHSIGSEKI